LRWLESVEDLKKKGVGKGDVCSRTENSGEQFWNRLRITEDCNRIIIRRGRGRRGGGGGGGGGRIQHWPVNISEQNLQSPMLSDTNTRFEDGRDNFQCNFHISHRPHVCNR
jgi:hypothetical protein